MNTIEEIISSLRIAMTDARQNESHFESWMILNEAICDAIDALTEQPAQQEPAATVYDAYDTTGIDWHCKDAPATGTPLYTTPPRREWVGLTDEEILQTLDLVAYDTQAFDFAYRIEAKLKEKNTS